jgi:hypothetical protein
MLALIASFNMPNMLTYFVSFPYRHSFNLIGVQMLRRQRMVVVEVKVIVKVTISRLADLLGNVLTQNSIFT